MSGNRTEMTWSLSGMLHCLAVIVVCCVLSTSACFITNCPLGGKRSLGDIELPKPQRECLSCGPHDLGQCIGPNICCGPLMGCQINSAESKVCERENEIPTPCRVEGKPCGDDGNCVANGICCTESGCNLDSSCYSNLENRIRSFKRNNTPELLTYIKRLLETQRMASRK